MRRRNRFAAALSLAGLLLAGVVPPAAAESTLAPLGRFATLVDPVANWWMAFWQGDADGRNDVSAASETEPSPDPDGNELLPDLDPDGMQAVPEEEPNVNELLPRIDPNG